jgi:hypothetical protein
MQEVRKEDDVQVGGPFISLWRHPQLMKAYFISILNIEFRKCRTIKRDPRVTVKC